MLRHFLDSLRKYGPYLLIIAILVSLFAYIEPATILQRLRNITLLTIFCFFAIYALDFVIRSFRWKILLNACGATPKVWYLWSLFHSVWLVNNFLPSRIGEALRLRIVEEEYQADAGITIGTLIVEHLLDFLVLVGLAGISSYFVVGNFVTNPTTSAVLKGAVVFVGVILLMIALILVAGHKILRSFPFLPENLREQLFQVYLSLKASIQVIIQNRIRFACAIILSVILWLFETTTIFLITRGIGLQVSYSVCLLGASVGYLTFAAPITPGSFGTFELSTASLLSISSKVDLEDALIVPLIDRTLKMIYLVCLGVPFFLYHGLSISKVKIRQKT